jgi:hypothetical protein
VGGGPKKLGAAPVVVAPPLGDDFTFGAGACVGVLPVPLRLGPDES